MAYFDVGFGEEGSGLLKAFDFCSSEDFLLGKGIFPKAMIFVIGLAHAWLITALVVDEDVLIGALEADAASEIRLTGKDIDVAVTLEEVVVLAALQAGGVVWGRLAAGNQVELRKGWLHEGQNDKNEEDDSTLVHLVF